MKLSEITEINGKKLTKPQVNLLTTLETKYGVKVGGEKEIMQNPYTGATAEMDPLPFAIADWVLRVYRMNQVGRNIPVSFWDRAKYFVLAFWPKIYLDFID